MQNPTCTGSFIGSQLEAGAIDVTLSRLAGYIRNVCARWPMECVAVVPCLNEAPTIAEVIAGARLHLEHVWVVDDGSTDDTSAVAATAGARALRLPVNRGKGAALAFGLNHAHCAGFKWALVLDGDGQHDPAAVPDFFAVAEDSGAALVIGDRTADSARMPWLRRRVNRWMSRRLSRLAGRPLPDSQCGFRLLSLTAWERLRRDLRAARFETESDLLLAYARMGERIEFVPITVVPSRRPSRIRPVVDSCRWLRWWIAALRSVRPQWRGGMNGGTLHGFSSLE